MKIQTILFKDFPESLKNIPDPPQKLYILGNLQLINSPKIIAIVGTRQISNIGYQNTVKIAKSFVKKGFIIISGLALGVDGVAHQATIDNGGKTIAVLGAGVDIIYPKIHTKLYHDILDHDGAIISEIEPGRLVPREKFAARNRIISGLTQVVIIPEANLKSGSMVTARLALDQGKDIYCVSGSPGCDYLIDQGAHDILHEWI